VRQVARLGYIRNAYRILVGLDGSRILEWTLQKQSGKVLTGLIRFGVGTSGEHL
jgi:hypothetical protein